METKHEHESPQDRLIRLFELEGAEESMIAAQVGLVVNMQFAVQAAMKKRGINQKKLAKIMGCSAPNISQMLADDANPKIETIARALAAMKEKFIFASESLHGEWITINFDQKMVHINEKVSKGNNLKEIVKDFENIGVVFSEMPKRVKLLGNVARKANDNSWLQSRELSEQIKLAA